jgi:hypothetical protein
MANDPTLNRPMFTPVQPTLPMQQMASPGISALPRPDVEAQNLRNLFTPTPADTSTGQPVQSFQHGGAVMSAPSAMRGLGATEGIAQIEIPPMLEPSPDKGASTYTPRTPFGRSLRDFFTPSGKALENIDAAQKVREQQEAIDRAKRENQVPTIFDEVTDAERQAAIRAQREAVEAASGRPAARAPVDMFTGPGGGETYSNDPARSVMSQLGEAAGAPPPPPAATRPPVKPKGELELSLEAIRSRRGEDRKENALLALMQAGFATAAGQSPNALSNIGAGGQAGIAAFAGMERASREDQRDAMRDLTARRRDVTAENLAREKLAQDPDQIRSYAIMGGYLPGQSKEAYQQAVAKGYSITQSKEGPRLATSILTNPLITQNYTPEELKGLADYARRGIMGMGNSGAGSFPGFRDVTPR